MLRLILILLLINCAAPQKPAIENVIKTGDNLINDVKNLEKNYKKNPNSVTIKDIQDISSRIQTKWPIFRKTLLESELYGDYWKKQYESNEWFAKVGKWLIGIMSLLAIIGIIYGAFRAYLKFGNPLELIKQMK